MNIPLNIETFLFVLFVFTLLIQLFYYLFFFLRISIHKTTEKQDKKFPISVIIAARNEEQNLLTFLPKVLAQNYPNFEVIVINDRSWDESIDVLMAFEQKNSHLKIVDIPERSNDAYAKKMALTIGIKAAKNDRLLFLDADCNPNSLDWITEMSEGFNNNKMIVLGASPYIKKVGFLNKLIRFDTAFIAIQYLSFAKAKTPYMGVGRNLGYTKEVYDSVRGFKSHYHISSGDDDLFVNEASDAKNTSIVFNEASLTFSEPKTSFKDWKTQKLRHLTTGDRYKKSHLFLITLFPFSLIIFYLTAISLMLIKFNLILILGLLFLKLITQIIIFRKPLKIMDCKDLVLITPLLELCFLFITPIFLSQLNKIK